jgi:adenosine deaminase
VHMRLGVPWPVMAAGLAEGLRAAEADHGLTGRLVAAVDRQSAPSVATDMVREILAHPLPQVVAIGMDFDERKGAPEAFAEAYRLARAGGLRATAHAGEHVEGPAGAANITTCLDLLGCDRIDHGYHVLSDMEVVRRCREEGVPFDVAFTTSRRALRAWRRQCVAEMIGHGLQVNVSSDDPALFPTTVARELDIARTDLKLSEGDLVTLVKNGVEASFMAEEQRRQFMGDIGSALEASGGEP